MPVSEERDRRRAFAGTVLAIFLLLLARTCAFGFQYYLQLDDYTQYYNPWSLPRIWELHQTSGILAYRPLAIILDHTLWSLLPGHLIWAAAVMCLLYALAAVMIWEILKRYFRLSPIFPVVMALLPLGMEGTYWLSASTRVVVGTLLAALSAWAFLRWLDRGGIGRLLLYMVLQLLPFGFYEQAGVLAVTLTVGAALLEWGLGRHALKQCAVAVWALPAMGIVLLITKRLSVGSAYEGRSSLVLPVGEYYWNTFFPGVLRQFWDAFARGGFYTLAKGFVRGARMVLSGQLLLWAAVVILLCVLLRRQTRSQTGGREGGTLWLPLLSGVLLAAGPASIFLVLANAWFSLRGTVTSFPGIALIADAVFLWLWGKLPLKKEWISIAAAALAFVFCVAGASELKDYRDTCEADRRVAALVGEALNRDGVGPDAGRVGILNVESSYLPNQNFNYHEHIHGCTESAWAFGNVLAIVNRSAYPPVTPLPSDPLYQSGNAASNDPLSFDLLYCFSGETETVERVELRPGGESSFYAYNSRGEIIGYLWDEQGIGYFRLADQMPQALAELFFTEKIS